MDTLLRLTLTLSATCAQTRVMWETFLDISLVFRKDVSLSTNVLSRSHDIMHFLRTFYWYVAEMSDFVSLLHTLGTSSGINSAN